MVWVPLANGDGQVVKGIKLKDPKSGKTKTVSKTSRKGINRYEITFDDGSTVMNHEIRKKKGSDGWSVVGGFHSPEKIAQLYGRKVDPDANLPRPMRASFWKMKSKPGTHNYRQKKKLMADPKFKKFKEYFATTLDEARPTDPEARKMLDHMDKMYADRVKMMQKRSEGQKKKTNEDALQEGPKDAAGKDVFVKKIAKSAGVDYKKAGAIAAAAGRKRLGKAEFQKRVEAGQKKAAAARSRGEKYKG